MVETKKLLDQLNEKQQIAVTQTEGPVLVLAGAGSGKTRALTYRVAYLIQEKKINPRNILAVTFTNKAAGEMRERIKELLELPSNTSPYSANIPHVGTFHSICIRILRQEIEQIGYGKNFIIYDDRDQLALIKKVMKELEISEEKIKAKAVLGTISRAKSNLLSVEEFVASTSSYYEELAGQVYLKYQSRLESANAVDFDDIIMLTVKLFQGYPKVLDKYQEIFRYILVDEYQDTNQTQYIFLKLLANKYSNICVVGDDWQCLPKGSKIKTKTGWKNIEKIVEGDFVLAAAGRGDVYQQKVTRVKKSKYKGVLLEIKTKNGKKLRCTPNHILFSKLSLKKDIFYVYLMYSKKFGYRIGQVKGARYYKREEKNGVGLNIRANQERADRMWVLKVTKTREDAFYWEQYLSLKYQIPTMVFLANKERGMKFSQELINRLFENIDTEKNVKKLFKEFCLLFEYPHHIPQATIRFDTNRKRLKLTLFQNKTKSIASPWNGHRISINSTDEKLKKEIEQLGVSTRKGKNIDWRTEITSLDFGKLEKLSLGIAENSSDLIISKKAFISKEKAFCFHPASHLRETMEVGVLAKNQISEDEVQEIKEVNYEGWVYDIDVENVHNYIAEGITVHNSIYGWREANIRNILEFEKDYVDAKVVLLEQNYRSTKNILDAAHCVIAKNVNQKKKKLWTENDDGELLSIMEVENEKKEANQIVKEIKRAQKEDNETLNDFAILYRTNAQSRALEEAFLKQAIPYKIVGGLKFYQRREVKDILSYLYFLINPSDEINFERIINQPARGMGKKTVERIIRCGRDKKISLLEVLKSADLSEYKINLGKLKVLNDFGKLMEKIKSEIKDLTVAELINKIYIDSGYRQMLLKEGEEGEVRHENIQELLTVAQKFESKGEEDLADFLEEVALVSQTDQDLESQDTVLLMTMHSAKGLEFNRVFMVGMEEGLFPHSRSIINPSEMEEERRLCYVGITRAKKKAYLYYTNYRNIYGSTQASIKSRFLDEIDQTLIEEQIIVESVESGFYEDPTLEEDPFEINSDVVNLKDGDRVSHPDFGKGMVISREGDLVTVAFPKLGLRKLSVKYAPLTKE